MMAPTMTDEARSEIVDHLEQEVGVLIRRIRRVIHERSRSVHPDLQPASYLLLSHLVTNGPMRASKVAEQFGIDKGAISRQVQHLVELGLLDRTPDPADGRATLVSASADAQGRLSEVNRHRREHLDEVLGDWDDDDLASFVALLARYNTSLGR
jgi:DNA-binding MarR family transcriptional regulator